MPKVPQPTKTPASISPALWQNDNREEILTFLGDHGGAYLFYQVMQNDPDPKSSEVDKANAVKVDTITNLQKAQFLAQADSMYLEGQTPVKKKKEAGNKEAIEAAFDGGEGGAINFQKIPAGVYGHNDLEKGLYILLRTMGKENYAATISGVSSTSADCGTKLLSLLNATISPKSKATEDQAKETYTTHKDTFNNNTNFVPWWTTLLLLQATKATLGIKESTRINALEDACDTIEQKCGHDSRWGFEICRWRLKSEGEQARAKGGDLDAKVEDETVVASFENHMRCYQQRRDLSGKEKANAVTLKTDYCQWCFKNKGVKWNNHTESTCRNKKRAESEATGGGGGGGDGKSNRGICHACGAKDHFVKDCPLVAKARALHVNVIENAPTVSVSAENKPSADAAANYSVSPPVRHAHQKRHPTASALMTTALLASAATPGAPMVAHFDSAATAHMGPDVRFLRDAKPSNVGIEVYNNEVVTGNMEGVFMSHSADGNLPDGQRGYTNPLLPTTLISGPQVVFEHPKQDVVLSEQHGSFMQPTTTACPICNKHENRINFNGGSAGFTLDIYPGRKATSEHAWNAQADNIEHMALAGEPMNNPEQVEKYGDDPIFFAVPLDPQHEKHDDLPPAEPHTASEIEQELTCMHFKQVIPICNPADPLTTIDQLASLKQARSTRRLTVPSLTEGGAARFKFLHTCFGGAITENNVGDFMSEYPEFAESARLPKALLHPSATRQLVPCHCCTRTHMRKENSPPPSTKQPAPLEEVHLDLFTYPDDPRYDAFFIDRCTRACWHYVLSQKSDLPAIVQQFVVDVNTLNHPVGSIYYSIETNKKYGIDAKAVNDYLAERKRPQRLRILYTDGAGESASDGFEEFLADLSIQHHMSIPESQHQNGLAEHGGGWRLVNMVRHDLDLSGLGPSFRRFCSSLNAQRMNYLPHSALQGRTPASILYPDRSLPFKYFLPFGCKATVLKGAAVRKANKLDPRGRDGVYIGTASPYGMQGFLVYLYPESGKGYGTVVVATHAKFDLNFFPARRNNKRVADFFATLPARTEERRVMEDLCDEDGILELDVDGTDEDTCTTELKADDVVADSVSSTMPPAPPAVPRQDPRHEGTNNIQPTPPFSEATEEDRGVYDEGQAAADVLPADVLQGLDAIAWEIKSENAALKDRIIDTHVSYLDPNLAIRRNNTEHLTVPEPDIPEEESSDDEDAAPTTTNPTASEQFNQIEARARAQDDTGRRLRSGTVHAKSVMHHHQYRDFIKGLIRDADPPDTADLHEQARSARIFARELTERERHYERAFHAGVKPTASTSAKHAQEAISHLREERKRRQRYVTDVKTGEKIDVITDGYYDLGANDITPDGRIETASFVRLLKKALKTTIKAHPESKDALAHDLKQLSTPKSVKDALASPQWREWRAAIDKELGSLIDKGVYEVRKIPAGVKAIPTKLVLRIKLKSDGTVEKYKVRCVALGFLQRAGLHYHPDECYSPMSDPSTTRTLVAVSNALNLNIDHLDVAVAFLNGVLPPDQRFFCLPPSGFEEENGYGWYMLKGLYGTRQGGALWAKTFRDWMRREQPQFVEAGNERVCYVFREGQDGQPIDLDKLRGITLESDEKLIILCMNTDDMLISYTDSARHLVDDFERSLNASYAATPRTPLEFYLGMHVQRDREKRVLSIDVRRHIYDFIRSMGLDPFSSASVSTPLDPNVTYSKDDCPAEINAEIKERVLRAHGKLIHMAIWARPDLAHCVSVLGRYVHNPSQKHLDAYLRVARYLIKTKDLRIVYGTHDTHGLVLYGFSDSDWGADPDSYKSTGAYIFFLDGAACSWKVKLSSTALLSSQESEYVAGSEATKEALNLRMLLEHLGFGDPRPTDIYVDNKGAITMGLHPANKPATRHVNMRMHMLRHHVELGHVCTPFCPTFDMVADYMTKATPKPTHERHNARAMGNQTIAPPLTVIQHLLD